ncbi:MAG TPA: tetratricopeptide repeat protein [Candidatus Saccharimonadales bacterium]|nr:tetratricopeptide repeat protein [Candidatus Saccharimonadales bacterium]
MRFARAVKWILPLVALVSLASIPSLAGNTGSLRVEVTSSDGKPLPGARLVLTDPGNSSFREETRTDRSGRADILGLAPRAFDFQVSLEGFVTYESNFLAAAGARTVRKITLLVPAEAGAPEPPPAAAAPDPAVAAYNEAVGFYRQERMVEALARLDSCLSLKPGDPAASALKGIILEGLGRCDEAMSSLEAAAAASPPRKEALLPLVRCLEKAGRQEEADRYRRLLQSLGRTPQDLYNEAVGRINEGNNAEAFKLIEAALAADPGFAPAQYQYALLLVGRGDTAAAIPWIEKYLAAAPDGEFAADARQLLSALKP